VVPGFNTVITPAQVHMSVQVAFSAGRLLIITVAEPGTHGATVTGTHGTGEPSAAITAGLVGALHIPNGMMFTIGAKSMIVAAGFFSPVTGGPFGSTINALGATPNEHLICAVATTSGAGMAQR
jgi:hypothetical protein